MCSTHLKGCLVCSSSQMDHLLMNTRPLFSLTYHAIFLLFLSLSISKFSLVTTLSNETDKLALLEFKSHIDSPLNVLASWNDSFHFCHWVGVTCGNKHQRVIGLDLKNKITKNNMVGDYGKPVSPGWRGLRSDVENGFSMIFARKS